MTQVSVTLPLFKEPSYQYSIALEKISRTVKFNWNDRTQTWQMDVYNEDGAALLIGQRLVIQYPMFVDYQLDKYGMTGYFILMPENTEQNNTSTGIAHIPERYVLFYVYEEVE